MSCFFIFILIALPVKLNQICRTSILERYSSVNNFAEEIQMVIPYVDEDDKIMLVDIMLYFKIVFHNPDISIDNDIKSFYYLASRTVERLKCLCEEHPHTIFCFLYEMISNNVYLSQQEVRLKLA